MTVPARISIVTLGVVDVARSVRFYETLGWQRCASSMKEIAWFRTADSYLGLFGWQDLADDANLTDATRGSFGGITLAINVETADEVDAALDEAVVAGGTVLQPGTEPPFGYGGLLRGPRGPPLARARDAGLPFRPGRTVRV